MATKFNLTESEKSMLDTMIQVADTNREVYSTTDWLQRCIEKRLKKNKLVLVEHLANCSTMKRVSLATKRETEKRTGFTVTKPTRKEFENYMAESIINYAKLEIGIA